MAGSKIKTNMTIKKQPEKKSPEQNYTIKSDIMYGGKVLKPGEKNNFSKLDKEQINSLLKSGVIEK